MHTLSVNSFLVKKMKEPRGKTEQELHNSGWQRREVQNRREAKRVAAVQPESKLSCSLKGSSITQTRANPKVWRLGHQHQRHLMWSLTWRLWDSRKIL